jgi:hypothetical protein
MNKAIERELAALRIFNALEHVRQEICATNNILFDDAPDGIKTAYACFTDAFGMTIMKARDVLAVALCREKP